MFSRKKEESPKKRRANASGGLSQFGLMDVDVDFGNTDTAGGASDDDESLEAELLALTSQGGRSKPVPKRGAAPAKNVKPVNLDSMIAASMRDIGSDEELSGDDDPDLLNELSALNEEEAPPPPVNVTPAPATSPGGLVSLLNERLKMYQEAQTNAQKAGESSRARRFARGIKTLSELLKAASAGKPIDEADIPPPVAISINNKADNPPQVESNEEPPRPETVPVRPAPPPPTITPPEPAAVELPAPSPVVDTDVLKALMSRRDEYKQAAVAAKKAGDTVTALKYVKITKQFDPVISAVENGQPVDLKDMPPPPSDSQPSSAEQPTPSEAEPEQEQPGPSDPGLPPPPSSVKEALEQRLAKYRSVQSAAQDEGNSSKARRTGRIVKQYEDALKLHMAGKPFPVEDLPTPPGFAPIPVPGAASAAPAPAPAPAPAREPSPPAPVAPPRSPLPPPRQPGPSTPAPATPEAPPKTNVRKSPQSRQEKQLALLLTRQKEFKEAALEAKRNGEVNQAKEYLRLSKGFDPLIEASNCGLPVDMNTVPIPPGTRAPVESDFDMVSAEDCLPGTDTEVFEKLEADLLKQAKMCLTTRDHFKAVGDVASANRFEQLAVHSKKDLDTLRYALKRSEPVPKFHYETKTFSIVQCCTDLGDNDLELTIVQGINYTVSNPKDVDTYVKFEFPYPSEDPLKDRTPLVKDTNNPEYNATFPLAIHRNSRACQRVFKRHSIKLEVWSRGSVRQRLRSLCCVVEANKQEASGFLRSDTLIGTTMVKLLPLETKCTLHDSFDLMDGRKPVGGKLEVKVRLRNPMVTKQVEQVNEKWLIIDKLV